MNIKFSDIFFRFFNYNTTEAFLLRTLLFFAVNMYLFYFPVLDVLAWQLVLARYSTDLRTLYLQKRASMGYLESVQRQFCCRNLMNNKNTRSRV